MIGIIGVSCALPGGIESPEAFWKLLLEGDITVGPVPPERWNLDRYYHPDPSVPGKTHVPHGNFLHRDPDRFDHQALRISAREAKAMDPQQRLLLELTWQALEEAGLPADRLQEHKVGVYMGGFTLDHLLERFSPSDPHAIGPHTAAGSTLTMLSNRISHVFGFTGPSFTLDTACSSSLVAFHYACQDLQQGHADVAVVGGVNIMLRPEYPIGMSKGGFLAADGRSKSFDRRADGYGRGEGAVVLILKRLENEDFQRHRVRAVYRASGVNQDGHTPGITLPDGHAQVLLMREVLARSGLEAGDIVHVEAHGTGTPAGDPTEFDAIKEVYGQRPDGRPCRVGSAKSNIGHLEAAAGVVGILKSMLILEHGQIPPVAELEQVNPEVTPLPGKVELAETLQRPPADAAPMRVAVNSFGYGGTNAHVILEAPPSTPAPSPNPESDENAQVLLVTGAGEGALKARARQVRAVLEDNAPLGALAATLKGTLHLNRDRYAVVARNRHEAIRRLDALLQGEAAWHTATRPDHRLVFVYTGMGPQRPQMGKTLLEEDPVFREAAHEWDAEFQRIAGFSLLEVLLAPPEQSRILSTLFAQTSNFLLQYALTRSLAQYGITPTAVVGHSVGEVAAAQASGALTLSEAVRLSYTRARLQASLEGEGRMMAVALEETRVRQRLETLAIGDLSVAAVNGPQQLTLSGPEPSLRRLADTLAEEEIFHRLLDVQVPYHSPVMERIEMALLGELGSLQPHPPQIPCYSTVTGDRLTAPPDPDYWYRNAREAVRFQDAVESLLDDGYTTFLEVGPHPVLARYLQEIAEAKEQEITLLSTLRKGEDDAAALRRSVEAVHGRTNAFQRPVPHWQARVPLPPYPWERVSLEMNQVRSARLRQTAPLAPLLDLPGERTDSFVTDLDRHALDYLTAHVVDGAAVLPGAAMIEVMLEAAQQILDRPPAQDGWVQLEALRIHRTLPLRHQGARLHLDYDRSTRRLRLFGAETPDDSGVLLAEATLRRAPGAGAPWPEAPCPVTQEHPVIYRNFADIGLESTAPFQVIERLARDHAAQHCRAWLQLDETIDPSGHWCHPTLLDGVIQCSAAFVPDALSIHIPVAMERLRIDPGAIPLPARLQVTGRVRRRLEGRLWADLQVMDAEGGRVLMELTGLQIRRVREPDARELVPTGNYLNRWVPTDPAPVPQAAIEERILLLVPQELDSASALQSQLEALGATVELHRLLPGNGHWQIEGVPLRLDARSREALTSRQPLPQRVLFWCPMDESAWTASAEALATLATWLDGQAAAERRAPTLLVVTQGAVQFQPDQPCSPAGGALVGLTRVCWSELEHLQIRSLDLAPGEPFDPASVIAELLQDTSDDEILLRNGQRHRALLERHEFELDSGRCRLQPGNTYHWTRTQQGWIKQATGTQPASAGYELWFSLQAPLHFLEQQRQPPALLLGCLAGVRQEENPACFVALGAPGRENRLDADQLQHMHISTHSFTPEVLLTRALEAWALWRLEQDGVGPEYRMLLQHHPLTEALGRAARSLGATVVTTDQPDWDDPLAPSFDQIWVARREWEEHQGYGMLAAGGRLYDLDLPGLERLSPGVTHPFMGLDRTFERFIQIFEEELPAPSQAASPPPERHPLGALLTLLPEDLDGHPLLDWRIPPSGCDALATEPLPLNPEEWLLVTGGLGGLGEQVVRWLQHRGHRKLLLCGRRPPEALSDHPFLKSGDDSQAPLSYLQLDLGRPEAVERLKAFQVEHGPITQLFHLAGLIDDHPLSEMDHEAFQRVLHAKAVGLEHLLQALDSQHLRCVVGFSSIALITGNSRQANYCAANHHLTNRILELARQGVRAVALHVGGVRDVGMVSRNLQLRTHLENTGLIPMHSRQLLAGLERALARGDRQATLTPEVDWDRWQRMEPLAARAPRFEAVLAEVSAQNDDLLTQLRADLADIPEDERPPLLAALMGELVGTLLGRPDQPLEPETRLSDLGIDSLIAAEIQAALKQRLGLDVSILTLIEENMHLLRLATLQLNRMDLGG